MGHAHHFLSRLDRLSQSHVELALALYRDHERLRYVLEQSHVPEGADRVAVSLDDPHEGPFVLVTRTGRFVTCLARGMRSELPIITRADLDAITARHELWQDREEARRQLTGPEGEAAFLLGRILDSGPCLAREEFQALAALHPLIGDEYFEICSEWALTARRIQLTLKTALKKRGARLRPDQLDKLELYWKTFFAAGHLAVLSLVDGGEMLHRRAGGDARVFEANIDCLTSVILDGGIICKTMRGTWALGQLGEAGLAHARRRLAAATTGHDVLRATFTLLAIGARDEALRPEVVRAFDPIPPLATEEARTWATYVCGGGVKLLADIDSTLADHQRNGAIAALGFSDFYPINSPYHYERVEDVPADIAFAEPLQLPVQFLRDPDTLPKAIPMIIPAARATPEQLYLPRRCVEFLDQKWAPESSLMLLEGWLNAVRAPTPRRTEPTRGGPCPCGSGKKYKRCCAGTVTT